MIKKHKILIVDDLDINRSILSDMLCDEYEILEASDGSKAISILNRHFMSISLVLLDIVMPQVDGFEVLRLMNENNWIEDIPVIMISAEKDSQFIEHAYDLGAVEYIKRPFDPKIVNRRVTNTIIMYSKQKKLENMVIEQFIEKERNSQIMVEILSQIVEFRNGESGLHVLHIRIITEELLKQLVQISDQYQLSKGDIAMISNASALHDIGKMSIAEEILNKPGRLTPEEFEVMKEHTIKGAQMLEAMNFVNTEGLVNEAYKICRWHHERYDGSGYPDGLKGEEIPISAQVVSLADVYDALTSKRVYKPAFSHEKAMDMILSGECGSFNPILLQCLKQISETLRSKILDDNQTILRDNTKELTTKDIISSGVSTNYNMELLELDRVKYQFITSASHNIQFEYSFSSKILNFYGLRTEYVDIPDVIINPLENKDVHKFFPYSQIVDMNNRIRNSTPDNSIIQSNYYLRVNGKLRLHKVIARVLWLNVEQQKIIGIVGKMIDLCERVNHIRSSHYEFIDKITNVANLTIGKRVIDKTLKSDHESQYALLFFDLERFRLVSDIYQCTNGKKYLRDAAKALANVSLTMNGTLIRVIDNYFGLFLRTENIKEQIEQFYQTMELHYEGFVKNVRMGVTFAPRDGNTCLELLKHGAEALIDAYENGLQYSIYNETMVDLSEILEKKEEDEDNI